jgi:hypothetical protein
VLVAVMVQMELLTQIKLMVLQILAVVLVVDMVVSLEQVEAV